MLKKRVITALVIMPPAIAGIVGLYGLAFALFTGLFIVISAWEWASLAGLDDFWRIVYTILLVLALTGSNFIPPGIVLALGLIWWLGAFILVISYPKLLNLLSSRLVLCAIGILILVPVWISLLQLKLAPNGNFLILLLFFLVWGADTGAYFFGRAFGTRKLAPQISPGKSWAGFYGGVATALPIAILMLLFIGKPDLLTLSGMLFIGGCLVVAMVSVLGDLTISVFKRHAGVKDTGSLLPGHGGFLDRLDSLLAAGPFFGALVLYSWNQTI